MPREPRSGAPRGIEAWFVAGFLAGAERALTGRRPQRELFTSLAKDLLRGDDPGMRRLLESVVAAYAELPARRREEIAGIYSGLDVQLPLDRVPDRPAGPPLGQARGDAKPDKRGEDQPPKPPPDLVGKPRRDDCECCQELQLRLESVRVERETDGLGADDVLVTALSTGVVIEGVQAFVWPTGPAPANAPTPREMKTGASTTPNVVIARVKPDSGCHFSLDTEVRLWEIDNDKIDELMRRAIVDLVQKLSAKAGVLGAPGSVVDLIGAVVDAIIDLLDLRDNEMDAIRFTLTGRLCSKPDVTTLGWAPPWGSQAALPGGLTHAKVDDHTARIGKRIENLGGIWHVSLMLQRICA